MEENQKQLKWTKKEKVAARLAFDNAYKRECGKLLDEIKEMVQNVSSPEEVWGLIDLLTEKKATFEEKYTYQYAELIPIFARLTNEGWLTLDELSALHEEKVASIRQLAKSMS